MRGPADRRSRQTVPPGSCLHRLVSLAHRRPRASMPETPSLADHDPGGGRIPTGGVIIRLGARPRAATTVQQPGSLRAGQAARIRASQAWAVPIASLVSSVSGSIDSTRQPSRKAAGSHPGDPRRAEPERVPVAPADEQAAPPGPERAAQAPGVARPLLRLEDVEQADVEERVEDAPEVAESDGVEGDELGGKPALEGLRAGTFDRAGGDVDSHDRHASPRELERVLARPAPHIQDRAGGETCVGEADHGRLWAADLPARGCLVGPGRRRSSTRSLAPSTGVEGAVPRTGIAVTTAPTAGAVVGEAIRRARPPALRDTGRNGLDQHTRRCPMSYPCPSSSSATVRRRISGTRSASSTGKRP